MVVLRPVQGSLQARGGRAPAQRGSGSPEAATARTPIISGGVHTARGASSRAPRGKRTPHIHHIENQEPSGAICAQHCATVATTHADCFGTK
ncbi:unnamed protein product [Arctia plantaginis]|uniref:Uncharacterized protein n=1 Tax=Arctia plantaginis TaxID=874455 RepID=A0A8S1APV8_ARCPL|nr:unnamed protein product [Arctia plantaginis]